MNRRGALKILLIPPLLTAGRAFALDIADLTRLKPGEFIWRPELSPQGPVVVVVSLPHQIVHVFRNGLAIGASTCSTGAKGHATPTGVFTILQKRKEHYSSTYNNAPMPNMQRLFLIFVAAQFPNTINFDAMPGLADFLNSEHARQTTRGELAASLLMTIRNSVDGKDELAVDLSDVGDANSRLLPG